MKQFFLTLLAAALFTGMASAQTSQQDRARIQLLEDQVLEMKTEIRRLRMALHELQNDFSRVQRANNRIGAAQDSGTPVKTKAGCDARIEEMKVRLEQLRALGYKDGHPDVASLSTSITRLETNGCPTAMP